MGSPKITLALTELCNWGASRKTKSVQTKLRWFVSNVWFYWKLCLWSNLTHKKKRNSVESFPWILACWFQIFFLTPQRLALATNLLLTGFVNSFLNFIPTIFVRIYTLCRRLSSNRGLLCILILTGGSIKKWRWNVLLSYNFFILQNDVLPRNHGGAAFKISQKLITTWIRNKIWKIFKSFMYSDYNMAVFEFCLVLGILEITFPQFPDSAIPACLL